MKKSVGWLILCVFCCVLAALALVCGITATGSGFLDLSNVARMAFFAAALLFLLGAVAAGRIYRKTKI